MTDLPEGWVETSLGEVSSSKQYGYTESASTEKIGPKFLRITDIQHDFIDWKAVPYCPISEKDKLKYKLGTGDVVIARTGNSTGATATIKNSNVDAVFASYLIRFKINPQIADYNFIDFSLRSKRWTGFVKSVKGGSAQGGANANNFAEYPINLPPLPEQKAIADMLSSFDDKTELLREQNKTLETLAQTIFKEWFVNFNYPDATGEMVESELGLIPKGWRVERLGEALEVKRGGSPRPIKDYLSDSGYRWLKISDATATSSPFIFEIKEHIKKEGLKKTTLLKKGSLVLSNSATPGVPKFLELDSCIHDGWLHFPSTNVFSYQYLYLFFQHIRKPLLQQGNGSVFKNLKTDILKNWLMVIPDVKTINDFNELISLVFEKIKNNASQIQSLSKNRDTLLPKLLSGEVRIINE